MQLFWNVGSVRSQSLACSNVNVQGLVNHAAFLLLLAVVAYCAVLGFGLWNLQKWTLFFILPIWFLDLTYGFNPALFGLEHASGAAPQSDFSVLGFGIADYNESPHSM